MKSIYNKKCYFFIKNKYYSGRITTHKKNKYFIVADKQVFSTYGYVDVVCLDVKDIYFAKDMEKIIENQVCLYIAEILIDNEIIMVKTMSSLYDLFPNNIDLKNIQYKILLNEAINYEYGFSSIKFI